MRRVVFWRLHKASVKSFSRNRRLSHPPERPMYVSWRTEPYYRKDIQPDTTLARRRWKVSTILHYPSVSTCIDPGNLGLTNQYAIFISQHATPLPR